MELRVVLPEGTQFSRVSEVSWFCLRVVHDSIPFLIFLEYTFKLFLGAVFVVGVAVSTAISSTFSDVVSSCPRVGFAVSIAFSFGSGVGFDTYAVILGSISSSSKIGILLFQLDRCSTPKCQL